jgi:hypothetical protein
MLAEGQHGVKPDRCRRTGVGDSTLVTAPPNAKRANFFERALLAIGESCQTGLAAIFFNGEFTT